MYCVAITHSTAGENWLKFFGLIYNFKRDTATTTTLRPVTPPCFECTTQTAERPAKLCGDYVVTFKYACTEDPCHTTNPCCTHKFGCKKTKTNKSCYIEQMEAANRKSNLQYFYHYLYNIHMCNTYIIFNTITLHSYSWFYFIMILCKDVVRNLYLQEPLINLLGLCEIRMREILNCINSFKSDRFDNWSLANRYLFSKCISHKKVTNILLIK